MTTRVATYSADQYDLAVGGFEINSGFDDGEFLSIEMAAAAFTDKVGADGEVVRSKTNDRRATIKIKLLQTSEGNDKLMQLLTKALDSPNGADVGAFQLTNKINSVVEARAAKVWVSEAPKPGYGREAGSREWTLRAAHMNLDLRGNPSL